jgi:hypothetical protein
MFWDALGSISPEAPRLLDIAQLAAGALVSQTGPTPKDNG